MKKIAFVALLSGSNKRAKDKKEKKRLEPQEKVLSTSKTAQQEASVDEEVDVLSSNDESFGSTVSIEDFFREVMSDVNWTSLVELEDSAQSEAYLVTIFEEVIKVVYRPLLSQIPPSFDAARTVVESLSGYMNLGSQLRDTIQYTFPTMFEKEQQGFVYVWNKLHSKSFVSESGVNQGVAATMDFAVNHLFERIELLNDESYAFFQPANFNSKDYETWRDLEKRSIESLLQKSLTIRQSKPFTLRMSLQLNSIALDSMRSKLKASSFDAVLKYGITTSTTGKNTFQTKGFKFSSNQSSNNGDLKVGDIDIAIFCEASSVRELLKLQLLKKNLLSTETIGEVNISLKDVISRIQPQNCSWGVQSEEFVFPIIRTTQTEPIGELRATMVLQLEQFPYPTPSYVKESKDNNYYVMYDAIIQQMAARTVLSDKELLNSYQKWILEEFSNQHGISEVYKRLSIMREIVRRNDLLLYYTEEFKQCYDFVSSALTDKFVIITKNEIEYFDRIKLELQAKIEVIVQKFMTVLGGGKKNIFKTLIRLYEHINKANREQSQVKLCDLIQDAITSDYNNIRNDQINSSEEPTTTLNASVLINVAQLLKEKVDDILYYSNSIPSYCNFISRAMRTYYMCFTTDYEKLINSGGFSGYQMLYFCEKLRELNTEIEDSFEQEEIEELNLTLLDPTTISIGYETKFIWEVKEKLMGYMQCAVALDNWLKMNDEVLHSSSLVDFFTSAGETLSFISKLEFTNYSLLSSFGLALGEVVVEYARILKSIALKELSSSAKNESKAKTNERPCLLNLIGLCDKYKLNEEERDVVNITERYVVIVNNVNGAISQFKTIIQSINDEKSQFDDQSSDSDTNTDLSSESDSYNSDDESDSDNIRNIFVTVKTINNELISMIVNQFDPFVRISFSNILDQYKNINVEEAKKREKNITKQLSSMLFDTAITPNLTTLSGNIYEAAFMQTLSQVLSVIFQEVSSILLPPIPSDKDNSGIMSEGQRELLNSLTLFCEDYFYGAGEGLSRDQIARQKVFLRKVLKLYSLTTDRLIEIYPKFSVASSNRSLKSYHLLAVICSRSTTDPVAATFVEKNKTKVEELYLTNEFAINPDESTQQPLIVKTNHCGNERLRKGYYYLTRYHFLWSPQGVLRGSNEIFRNNESMIDTKTGKFKLSLSEITSIRPIDPWITKGMTIYMSSIPRIKISLGTRKLRDELLDCIVKQAKQIGNTITVRPTKKLSVTGSITRTHKIFKPFSSANPQTRKEDVSESTISTSERINVLTLDEAQVQLQIRFGIPGAILKQRFNCARLEDSQRGNGVLYLFDTCYCFDALSDLSMSDSGFTASLLSISSVSPDIEQGLIRITLIDGQKLVFGGFLSDVSSVCNSIQLQLLDYEGNQQRLVKLKQADENSYFLSRFELLDDKLLATVESSVMRTSSGRRIPGTLYIGNKNLCFEAIVGQELFVLNYSKVKTVKRNNWGLCNKCFCVKLRDSTEQRYVVNNRLEEIMNIISGCLVV